MFSDDMPYLRMLYWNGAARRVALSAAVVAAAAAAKPSFSEEQALATWRCVFNMPKGDTLNLIIVHTPGESFGRLIGNMGSESVVAFETSGGGVHFLERTVSGNVTVTSIMWAGREVGYGSRLPAIHSRHMTIDGDLLPSQAEGECELRF